MNRALLSFAIYTLVLQPAGADDSETTVPERDRTYENTALGAVIDANRGRVPSTGVELVAALAKLGDFLQLAIPFSTVDFHSGLAHPRVVIAMRPSTHPAPLPISNFTAGFTGWGGFSPRPVPQPVPPAVIATPSPLGQTDKNRPQLESRLFLAANMELKSLGRPIVKTVEFISWNTNTSKFDFGVIEGLGGGVPAVKMLDGKRCFSCHKNRGPILSEAPWSNSIHDPAVRIAAKTQLNFPHGPDKGGKEDPKSPRLDHMDGMKLLESHAVEVDAAIRQCGERMRDRAAVERLVRSENGRHVFAQLLAAIPTQKPIGDDKAARYDLNRLDLVKFLQDEIAARKVAPSNRLLDFNPIPTKAAAGNPILQYDAARSRDDAVLPSIHQPSNPKAFARAGTKLPAQPSDVVSVMTVARAVGLSEVDRNFLARLLREVAQKPETPVSLAKQIFAGPSFADVFETGQLPDRDDFKDRFVAGLRTIAHDSNTLRFDRAEYASAPVRDPRVKAEAEKTPAPSHACLACHDIRGEKSTFFNPIPPLAFDPFDPAGRRAWLKTADRPKRIQVLTRFVQRMGTDRDMPPEDSREAELFRGQEFDAAKDWLAAELKKVKG